MKKIRFAIPVADSFSFFIFLYKEKAKNKTLTKFTWSVAYMIPFLSCHLLDIIYTYIYILHMYIIHTQVVIKNQIE